MSGVLIWVCMGRTSAGPHSERTGSAHGSGFLIWVCMGRTSETHEAMAAIRCSLMALGPRSVIFSGVWRRFVPHREAFLCGELQWKQRKHSAPKVHRAPPTIQILLGELRRRHAATVERLNSLNSSD